MFTPPRIVPHEVVHDDSIAKDETYELDICEYGEVYEPNATMRVSQAPRIVPSGHLGGEEYEVEPHGEQPYYSNDASSGKQGAGK